MHSVPHTIQTDFRECAPEPDRGLGRWWAGLGRWMRRDPDRRWGSQLLRISSDMILICDESLGIQHHNRAFLKGVGHAAGNFRGRNLTEFFPAEEGGGVSEAFEEWRSGHAAGMRFQAPLLTTKGPRRCDFRAVRSRDGKGAFVYYLVAREMADPRRQRRDHADEDCDPFFRGLPVAAWRTDSHLRITHAYGSLWPELGVASEDLLGESFGRRHDSLLPAILRGIDCGDASAGMSLLTELEREGETFQAAVEPVFDASGALVGTVGLLRRTVRRTVGGRHGCDLVTDHRSRHHAAPSAVSVSFDSVEMEPAGRNGRTPSVSVP